MKIKAIFLVLLLLIGAAIATNYLFSFNAQSSADEIVLFLNLIFGGSIGWLTYTGVLKPLKKINASVREIVKGDHEHVVTIDIQNEFGELSTSIDQLREELYISEQMIANVETGQFERNDAFTEQSSFRLIEAMHRMQQKLQDVATSDEQRNWATQGLAQFADILRNTYSSRQELADTIISTLVKYVKANQGGLFVVDDDNPADVHLAMAACYAYERKKYQQKRIEIGEGLIGQIYLEKDTVFLTDIPTDYVHVTSGLGKATPTCILMVPLKVNEAVEGVIELALFRELKSYEIEFVEKLAESIASAVSSAKITERTHKLLEETHLQTEALRSQEEEMRQNMEEMQTTQEEMYRMQHKAQQNEANLQAIINCTEDSITAIDRDYRIILMNDVLRHRYAHSQFKDFKEGICVLDYLGEARDTWKDYCDRALNGEKYNFMLKSIVQGEDSHRHYFLGPITD